MQDRFRARPASFGRRPLSRWFSNPKGQGAGGKTQPRIHVVGAGLAGLSAAVHLVRKGCSVIVYEAARQAGGRCRSYHDATFGAVIDNGNHLLLSGNRAALEYLEILGAADRLKGPAKAEFPFVDFSTGERWTLSVNEGRWPAWLFDPARRVPGSRPLHYLSAAALMWAGSRKNVNDILSAKGPLYERLWQPLMLAALNTDPKEGSAKLAGAIMRETLAKGGAACRPLIADGLSSAFVEPALRYLSAHGATVAFGERLREIKFSDGNDRASAVNFGDQDIALGPGDVIVLSVPPWMAQTLLPGLEAPSEFRAILNAHFSVEPPPHFPTILGVVHGTVEWIFAFKDRLSITISGADRLIEAPREELAIALWQEVSAITGLPAELPRWQIVKEKRATFAATPEQNNKRPGPKTKWRNIFLAGDWTQTGLPATIEGAIRSGQAAARLAMRG